MKYGDENADRFLFVETNMRFYAFMPQIKNKKKSNQTSINLSLNENSTLTNFGLDKDNKDEKVNFYVNLLKAIFKIEMIFPDNGLVGYITRENIKKILKNSDSLSILQFLSDHMSLNYDDVTTIKGKKYLINESVVNQIMVLENEKKSVELVKNVVCYCDFYNSEQYKDLLNIMKRREIPIINEGNMINQIIVINQSDEKIIEKEYKSL